MCFLLMRAHNWPSISVEVIKKYMYMQLSDWCSAAHRVCALESSSSTCKLQSLCHPPCVDIKLAMLFISFCTETSVWELLLHSRQPGLPITREGKSLLWNQWHGHSLKPPSLQWHSSGWEVWARMQQAGPVSGTHCHRSVSHLHTSSTLCHHHREVSHLCINHCSDRILFQRRKVVSNAMFVHKLFVHAKSPIMHNLLELSIPSSTAFVEVTAGVGF